MKPGKTVFEWMQDHDVRSLGIDVRRFASFGVIKVRRTSIKRVMLKAHNQRRASSVVSTAGQSSSPAKSSNPSSLSQQHCHHPPSAASAPAV